MSKITVPAIDISPILLNDPESIKKRDKVLKEIGDACEKWGFFYITNHGVSPSLVEKATTLGHKFFSMPKSFKDKVARREVLSFNHDVKFVKKTVKNDLF